jgi:hypothetical protein
MLHTETPLPAAISSIEPVVAKPNHARASALQTAADDVVGKLNNSGYRSTTSVRLNVDTNSLSVFASKDVVSEIRKVLGDQVSGTEIDIDVQEAVVSRSKLALFSENNVELIKSVGHVAHFANEDRSAIVFVTQEELSPAIQAKVEQAFSGIMPGVVVTFDVSPQRWGQPAKD